MRIIKEKKRTYRLVSERAGDIRLNNVKISILNPGGMIELKDDLPRRFDKTNNDAIVMKIEMGNVSVLLPADISEPSEMRIVDAHRDIREPGYVCPSSWGIHFEHRSISKESTTRNCSDKLRQRKRI